MNAMRFRNIVLMLGLGGLACTVACAADDPRVPADFKIVARYGPGYSNWLRWQYTITADGIADQDIGPGGRGGGERSSKQAKLSSEDIAALHARVKAADLFTLKEQYKGKVTDNPTLVLEVTMDKKTHKVLLYGHRHLKQKEEQDAADRFLSVWSEVIRKVPAPNPAQKPEMYRPGNYPRKRSSDSPP